VKLNGRPILSAGVGFAEDGAQVATVDACDGFRNPWAVREADLAAERREATWRLIDRLVRDGGDARQVGARVMRLAFLLGHPAVPNTQRALAKAIGVSEGQISKALAADDWTTLASSKAPKPLGNRGESRAE
jgi:hypothetical protein